MSSRKRTKRKNSEEDFDVDEEDDGMDNDDINKWACHSCTFMNRAAAYRCFVCGTRKGTSTRRSRCNDNVVEMQKTITDLVQKQVEKEKSLKRRERSLLNSMTRETSDGPQPKEVKLEEPSDDSMEEKTTVAVSLETVTSKRMTPQAEAGQMSTSKRGMTPTTSRKTSNVTKNATKDQKEFKDKEKKQTSKKDKSASKEVTPLVNKVEKEIKQEETSVPTTSRSSTKTEIISSPSSRTQLKLETVPIPQPAQTLTPTTSSSTVIPTAKSTSTPPVLIPPNSSESSILQHLPERIVKKINQHFTADYDSLRAHIKITGIDPIVAEAEAVLLPQNWDRQKLMKELVSTMGSVAGHYVSPATSRQSSETDSSSSEANRSFETPLNETSPIPSKSCQIPDYMIHRDAPQKIFIVANGYPAYFEEFPRRIQ